MDHPKYIIRDQDKELFGSPGAVTEFLIYSAVKSCSPELNSSESIIFGKIQEQLIREVDLDASQKEWVLDKLEKADLPFNLSMWRRDLMNFLRDGRD